MTRDERIEYFEKSCGFAFTKDVTEKLKELGFFDAPASSKFHLCYDGGLMDHSINVAKKLSEITLALDLHWERKESPIIIGIFHDLCKCDLYYKVDDKYMYNTNVDQRHGEKSVDIAKTIVELTDEEIACIKLHMGAFTDKEKWKEYSDGVKRFQNVLWTHTADMYATNIMEV